MAAAGRTIESLHLRLSVVYALVAFLYVGLLVDFYLTFTFLRHPGHSTLNPTYLESANVDKDTRGGTRNEPLLEESSLPSGRSFGAEIAASDDASAVEIFPPHSRAGSSSAALQARSNDRKQGRYTGLDGSDTKNRKSGSGAGDEEGQDMDDKSANDEEREEKTDSVQLRVKRRAWRRARQYPAPDDGVPSVEFFPQPQTPQETDGYVWLTAYSRIPVQVLQEYCESTKKHCPPGDAGPPGIPGTPGLMGMKGERGDRGLPGDLGPRGAQGFPGTSGPVGPKGESGKSGIPGLDGRDGIPGEPGLDGVPGRDGIDGIPGRDGIPGIPGTPGRSGLNGTNGIPGSPGPRGPTGPPGPPGLPGPRGRKGAAGKSGESGRPGIGAWTVNGTNASILLIPPQIMDTEPQTTLMVTEGHDVRLKCAATGTPKPQITWRSDENMPIKTRNWQQSSVQEDSLEIRRISRDDMGTYVCIAANGVPPPASMKIKLEVSFPPLIKIRNQMVGTINGSYAVLECIIEAHPPAVNYWVYGDNKNLETSWKYKMSQKDDGYRSHVVLNITYIEPLDYGLYKCVSKNDKGKTPGVFTVFQIDPNIPTSKTPAEPMYEIYGHPPPTASLDTTVCEPCPTNCDPPLYCSPAGTPDISRIRNVLVPNATFLAPPHSRSEDCMIHQLGKPVFQRSNNLELGSWMQDALPSSQESEHKYYVANNSDPLHLYEYANRDDFRSNNISIKHVLHYEFRGNAHALYNGSFYYHEARSHNVIRFDLASNSSKAYKIPDAVFSGPLYLYSTDINYVDIAADENGLWIIYSSMYTNNTVTRKIHPYTLDTEYIWNISLPHRSVGDMFVTCGVLYAVNSVTAVNTQMTFSFDFYQKKVLEINIGLSNPFRQNTMISYNPKHKKIYTWDKGNQLVYPILLGTIDKGQREVTDTEHFGP